LTDFDTAEELLSIAGDTCKYKPLGAATIPLAIQITVHTINIPHPSKCMSDTYFMISLESSN